MSMASLSGIRITSENCLLTATLTDDDNPSSDALLSDNCDAPSESQPSLHLVVFQVNVAYSIICSWQ